ncbi:hypothetical protein [Streptomyces sp. NBC_01294]|uniref:hypothetical protein n=1 Tax=Streptomyces sp. NBC_01294 TaxID=2903815 RepID=UPI002DDBCA74|nr:hypothetical protein [Streptomyces sp. NBC_01294]WRZ56539.1 hypothetical protein OG534_08635 [Streptomyces sp. NBC_01294]
MSSSGIAFDHRRVQTAVIGNKNSDHPVILPMDAHELDMWRKAHPNYTYWCGIQLGGCGGELSDRRYTQKVCHFAHHPSAPICRRTDNGESSADHLFIKRGVQRLLKKQKVRGNVNTRNLGTGPGDAVDVHLPGGRRRLRFQLSSLDHRAWRRAADDLTDGSEDLDWIFGPDTPVSRELAGRHGFTLRVRCETVGGERRVHIGAEARDRTVQWTPLEDCTLTPTGLSTQHVEKIRLSLPRPKLPSFPLLGGLVFALVPEAKVPTSSPFAVGDRHLVVADFKPTDSPIVRALLSLPGDTDVPPAEHVYRIPESSRMLVTDDGRGWAVEANRYVRLNAHEAQRTGLWSPPPRSQADSPPPSTTVPPAGKSPEPQPARVLAPPKAPAAAPKAARTQADLVSAMRKALSRTAQRRSTTTWEELARGIGREVSLLSKSERIALLVAVDTPLWANVPVLCALIQHDNGPLPELGDVLDRLGVQNSKGSHRLKQWATVEIERAHAAYGQPSQAMKPRLELSSAPSVPEVTVAKALRTWVNPQMIPAPKRSAATPVTKRTDARISELIAELRKIQPKVSRPVRKRANKAVTGARVWLGELPVQQSPRKSPVATQSRQHHVSSLENALSAACKDIAAAQLRERQEQEQPPPAPAEPKESVPAPLPSAPKASSGTLYERLKRQLINAAAQGQTIPLLDLESGPTLPDETLRWLLTSIDRNVGPDAPLLSALVTAPDGGPVLFFRQILKEAGLAPPETDGWLTVVWRREQQRAHAAYANPPRELPPRLMPPA